MAKRKNDSLKFTVNYVEDIELDSTTVAHIYVLKTDKNVLHDELYDTIMKRITLTGYDYPELHHKILIVFEDLEEHNSYVCLKLHCTKPPIFISNHFHFDADCAVQDLHKLFQEWLDIQKINDRLYNLLHKNSRDYTNYTITEDDDDIRITIKK